jgi:hypothetical protein
MKTIDFLPDAYRQRDALRKARVWWALVVVVFGGAIGSSAVAQVMLRRNLQRQFEELTDSYTLAQAQVRELSEIQAQTAKAGQEASLFTYLQHPWPRTQLLAEIARPLSPSIRLTQLQVNEEEMARTAAQTGPRRHTTEEESIGKAPVAEQDLNRLQEEMDHRQTVIEIDGQTIISDVVHDYVAELSHSPLIAAASIKSLESSADKQQGQTQFTLRLVVRPGYGQRGNEGPVTGAKPGPNVQAASPAKDPVPPANPATTGGGG